MSAQFLTPPGHAPRSSSSPPSFLDAPPSARRLCRGPPTLFSARFTPSCTRARSAQGQGCVLCLPLSRSLSPARMLRTPCLSPRPVTHQRPRRCIQIDANARAGLQTPNRGVEGGIDNLHAYVTGHDVGVAAATSGANDEAGARRAGTRRATRLSVLRASRDTARGDIVVSRRGIDILHASRSQVTTWAWLLLLHASQM